MINLLLSLEFGTGSVFSAQQLNNHWWLSWKARVQVTLPQESLIYDHFCAWIFLKPCEDTDHIWSWFGFTSNLYWN